LLCVSSELQICAAGLAKLAAEVTAEAIAHKRNHEAFFTILQPVITKNWLQY